jgi:outer membrane receptor protein involved in Fe transport
MNFRNWAVLAVALIAMSAFSQQSRAQTQTTGDVTGVITDQSGAIVPDAKVSLKDNAKGATQDTQTGKDGVFHFYLLQPGNYTVTASATGFQSASRAIDVNVGQIATANLQLAVAGSSTTVTVTESAPLIQTSDGNVAATINQQQISEVPNPGNDLTFAAQMAAGTVMNTSSFGGLGNFSSFGISATANLFTLDGMDDNDPFLNLNNSGATNLALGTNEIQEATVVANGYTGQFGGLAGANVNYVTKSGGNQFHGNAIYYWNGDVMNSKDWFAGANPKLFSNANQWAGSLGGPIKKGKAFFFFNTEGLRVILPVTFPAATQVPTPSFEAATLANLTTLGLQNSIPFYNQMFSIYNTAAAGHTLTLLSCTGAHGLAPTVVTSDGNCAEQFNSGASSFTHEYQVSGRVDYNIGANDRAFLRIWHDKGFQASITDPVSLLFNVGSTQPQWSGQLNETHSFSSTMTNQFIASFLYYQAVFDLDNRAAALAAFPTTLNLADASLTSMGGTCCNANGDANFPNGRNVTQYGFSDDVSKTWGRHTVSFGGKFRRNDIKDFDYGQLNTGVLTVNTLTDLFNGGGQDALKITFPSSPIEPIALYTLGVYGQDEFRVKSNLTLTLALRVEHQSNPICRSDCFARLTGPFLGLDHDPAIPYNQAIETGLHQMLASLDSVLWQPRFGFAWQPFGSARNTVIRGGVGLFNDAFTGSAVDFFSENSPQENIFTPSNLPISPGETNGGNLFTQATLSNQAFLSGFSNGLTEAQIAATVPGFAPPGFNAADLHSHIPQYQKWNLEIQQGFGSKTSLSVNYVGNHGIHELIQNQSVNAFCPVGQNPVCMNAPFADLPTSPLDSRFGLVAQYQSAGVSNYNGVAVTLNHRFTGWGGGQFNFNYLYGHALDIASNGGLSNIPFSFLSTAAIPQDPFNIRKSYGPADYDVRHNISANYVWGLPIRQALRGRGFAPLVDGWQVAGTVFYHTGFPFSVIDGATGGALAGNDYNSFILPQPLPGTSVNCGASTALSPSVTPCFSAADFNLGQSQNAFTSGLRNAFRGPGYFDTDLTVMKNTKIPHWERGQLGIGFQFFNLFNHPNFAVPFPVVQSAVFGESVSTVSPPTSILGAGLGGDSSTRIIQLKAQFTF